MYRVLKGLRGKSSIIHPIKGFMMQWTALTVVAVLSIMLPLKAEGFNLSPVATAPLTITTPSPLLPNGKVTVPYSATLAASDGTPPYTWSIAYGLLPMGLSLNSETGVISGTPTASGTFWHFVQVTDASDPLQTALNGFITIVAPNSNSTISAATPPSTLSSIKVTPANQTIQGSATQQFFATGTYSDGSTRNITSHATWASSDTSVAAINSAGLATTVNSGSATISATLGGISNNTNLVVQPTLAPSPLPPNGTGTINSADGHTWSYLSNGTIRIGVLQDWGASVAYFSRVSPAQNLVNYYDKGREVQQSYYGNVDGSTWMGNAWNWNPVQAGCSSGTASTVTEFTNDGTTIYAKTAPLHWATCSAIQGYMEEWITLPTLDTAKIHFKFTYTGSISQAYTNQELPAAFFDYSFPNLVSYRGSSPWTDGPLTTIVPSDLASGRITKFSVTEPWLAYVNSSNWGIGLYTTAAPLDHITSYVYTIGSSGPTGSQCSYVSSVGNYEFTTSTPSYEYDIYLTIGSVTDIRSRFYAIHGVLLLR